MLTQTKGSAPKRRKDKKQFSPPPRPRRLDAPLVSRGRANSGGYASNANQTTRVAFEQTDNLDLETHWPVSFQLRLSVLRNSVGGLLKTCLQILLRALCAASRVCGFVAYARRLRRAHCIPWRAAPPWIRAESTGLPIETNRSREGEKKLGRGTKRR